MKIVKLSATWCMPCKALARTLEQVKADDKYKGVEFVEYDVENDAEGQKIAQEIGLSSVPTMLFYDNSGNIVFRMVGNVPRKDIETAIQEKLFGGESKGENEDGK